MAPRPLPVSTGEQVTTISFGLPHCPWRPERAKSLRRLLQDLGLGSVSENIIAQGAWEITGEHEENTEKWRLFTDKESNWSWSERMWTWMVESGSEFCVTIQDDCTAAPNFKPALRAMLVHLPRRAVLGLMAQHPAIPALSLRGERWVRTQSWAVGTGYGMWREDLVEFLEWRKTNQSFVRQLHEDQCLNAWIQATGRFTWHPIP